MEDIQVGEYVRTPYHKIEKIERITKEDGWICVTTNKNAYELEWLKKNNSKHSTDIFDLIENKDILKVKTEENEIIMIGFDENTLDIKYKKIIEEIKNKEYDLLEILTHEQYENNCYRIGE